MSELRGHLLRMHPDEPDLFPEVIHTLDCPVRWWFQETECEQVDAGPFVECREVFRPSWEYECGPEYETNHVGFESLTDRYGQGLPTDPGLYELIWVTHGDGEDFESGFRWEELGIAT